MKTLNIEGRDYTLEFTIEASLHKDCVEKITRFMAMTAGAEEEDSISRIISTMSDIPQTALTMFHAGLLEYHSDEIKTENDAKLLLKKYFAEHKEDETGNFYGMMQLLIECMYDDGFFKQIGLIQMMKGNETDETKKEPKKPQDHKRKTTGK